MEDHQDRDQNPPNRNPCETEQQPDQLQHYRIHQNIFSFLSKRILAACETSTASFDAIITIVYSPNEYQSI